MPQLEELELDAHGAQLEADVKQLVDKYLTIAEWDIPGINEPLAARLIVTAIRQALDQIEQAWPAPPAP